MYAHMTFEADSCIQWVFYLQQKIKECHLGPLMMMDFGTAPLSFGNFTILPAFLLQQLLISPPG